MSTEANKAIVRRFFDEAINQRKKEDSKLFLRGYCVR
jgi:hypothetical protein